MRILSDRPSRGGESHGGESRGGVSQECESRGGESQGGVSQECESRGGEEANLTGANLGAVARGVARTLRAAPHRSAGVLVRAARAPGGDPRRQVGRPLRDLPKALPGRRVDFLRRARVAPRLRDRAEGSSYTYVGKRPGQKLFLNSRRDRPVYLYEPGKEAAAKRKPTMRTITDLVAEHRKQNPKSRATRLFRFIRNGSVVKQMGCVACGAKGPTWSGNWRKTVTAYKWEATHQIEHERALVAEA